MKQAYKIINALDHGLPPHLEIRHYPKTTQEYLTWQIGEMTTRPEMQPDFDSQNRVIAYRRTGTSCSVYHLQAWGSTLERAKEMWLIRDAKGTAV